MRSKALVALERIVLSKRERVMALEPYEKGLVGTTLRYPYEVRDAKSYTQAADPLDPALLGRSHRFVIGKHSGLRPKGSRHHRKNRRRAARCTATVHGERGRGRSDLSSRSRSPHARG